MEVKMKKINQKEPRFSQKSGSWESISPSGSSNDICNDTTEKTLGQVQNLENLNLYRTEPAPAENPPPPQMSEVVDKLVCMADVEEKEIRWLWYPYIAMGKITLFRGDPGVGKTFFALAMAAIVSNGHGFPDCNDKKDAKTAAPANVLFLTAEDDLEDTIKPRLRKAQANMTRIYSYTGYITFSDPYFEHYIKEVDPRLVIIDPLQAFLGDGVDMHRANEICPIFSQIRQLAEKYNFALVILEHMNKNLGGKSIYRGLGSMDITGAARSVLMFGVNPDDESEKGFMHIKSNISAKGDIVGFRVDEYGLRFDPNTTITQDMILGNVSAKPSGRPSREIEQAIKFLQTELKNQMLPAKEILKRASDAGISERTLERAKVEADVDSVKKDKKWYWLLCDMPRPP
jgi:RecA-family ATPase